MHLAPSELSNIPAVAKTLKAMTDCDFPTLATNVESLIYLTKNGHPEYSGPLLYTSEFLSLEPARGETAMRGVTTAAMFNDNFVERATRLVLGKLKYHSDPAKRVHAATIISRRCPFQELKETAQEMLSEGYLPAGLKAHYWGRGRNSLGDPAPLTL